MKRFGMITCALMAAACALRPVPASSARARELPNIVVILGDNIGYGELSCYGSSRMLNTPRLDRLASEGIRLTNFNVEAWCAPSRSAFLTGRYGIRSGTSQAPDVVTGILPWEVTLAELLFDRGYSTAMFGKWHLGNRPGRYPTDQGFDEFWGIAKSWDNALNLSKPGYVSTDPDEGRVLSGTRGHEIERGEIFVNDTARLMDRTLADKSIEFMQRKAREKKPFFLYTSVSAVHIPVLCDPDFQDKSGGGPVGDAIIALDFHVGRILDAIDAAGITKNTIVIFMSDNGPEFVDPYRGTAGPWTGTHSTALEGALRAPFMMRWPGHVPAGRVSNEIVHITDLFVTIAGIAGAPVPADRMIDGVDEIDFLTAKKEHSNRDAFPVYLFGQLAAVKWQDWKFHVVWKPRALNNRFFPKQPEQKLFNLRRDPKEEYDVLWQQETVRTEITRWITQFEKTLVTEPPIPPGAPDSYPVPARK